MWQGRRVAAGLGWLLLGTAAGWMGGRLDFHPPRLPSTAVGPDRWTKYGLTAANNPVYESPAVESWSVAWSVRAPEPLQQASVARGVVFVGGDGRAPGDGNLYAFDAASGRLLWKTHLDNMSMTTPVVADGLVFVGTGDQNFRPAQFRLTRRLKTRGIVRGRGPSAIYAISATSGRIRWRFATPGEDMPSFVYRHGVLYVANGNGRVYALAAASGRLRWSLPIGSYVSMSSPALAGGRLFVSGAHPYRLYAIDVASGQLAWSRPVPGVFAGSDDASLAVAHGRVFLEGTGGTQKRPWTKVFAFSTGSGRLVWSKEIASGSLPHDIEVGSPVVAGNTVYAGSPLNGQEVALSASTGRIRWRFAAAGAVATSAAVVGGVVYVGDATGTLYALDAGSGTLLAARQLGGRLAADYPIVVGGTLYEPDENGVLVAMPLSAWQRATPSQGPWLPLPRDPAARSAVLRGLALFTQARFGGSGLTCSACHWGAGSLPGDAGGHLIAPLIGKAARFPAWRQGQLVTLDGQFTRGWAAWGARPRAARDPRLAALNAYLRWLASAFPARPFSPLTPHPGGGAGC